MKTSPVTHRNGLINAPRRLAVLGVFIVSALTLPVTSSVVAQTATSTSSVPPSTVKTRTAVASTLYDLDAATNFAQKCESVNGYCSRTAFVPLVFGGDISGNATFSLSGFVDTLTGRVSNAGITIFNDVTIRGCGRGSYATAGSIYFSGGPTSPGGRNYPGRFEVIPGSGTGDLRGLSGTSQVILGDPLGPRAFPATVTSTFTCSAVN